MLIMPQQIMTIWSLASLNRCAGHAVAGRTSPYPHYCVVTACLKALYKTAYSVYKSGIILKSKTWHGSKNYWHLFENMQKVSMKYQQEVSTAGSCRASVVTWAPFPEPLRGGKREAAPHNCLLPPHIHHDTTTNHIYTCTHTIINKILNRSLEDKRQPYTIVYWYYTPQESVSIP